SEPTDVVSQGEEADGNGAQLSATLNEPVAVGVGLEMVVGFDKRDRRLSGQYLGHLGAEARMGVDAGTDRGSTGGQLQDGSQRMLRPCHCQFHLPGIATELLSQSDRG